MHEIPPDLKPPRTTARVTPLADWRPALLATAAGLVALSAGTVVEALVVRALDANRGELEWLSDVVISMALAAMTYLWLHLKQARSRILRLAEEGAALDEQLRLAAEIQRDLLPTLPEATPGYRWAARLVPAGRIGGDFYDLVRPDETTALAIVADVTGKGIPAALILSALKTLFRTLAGATLDPGAIAERISAALYEEHGGMPYVTAIVARFETAPSRVTYINAGHPSAWIRRGGSVREALESGGPPLGILPGLTYAPTSLDLRGGDVGVLVTDGITEALEATSGGMLQALEASTASVPTEPLAKICEDLLRAASSGTGPAGVSDWLDDRTVFAFLVDPPA